MKLSQWARKTGISYWTAFRWFKAGNMPVPTIQTKTGTILVQEPDAFTGKTVVYARVSSSGQKADLDRQVARLMRWANQHKVVVTEAIAEIGSGLNGKRRKLLSMLRDRSVTRIVVEHRERLARFGFEMVEAVLVSRGGEIVVVEDNEVQDDLVRDMTEVLTSMCARLYGKRSARIRAEKALKAAQE